MRAAGRNKPLQKLRGGSSGYAMPLGDAPCGQSRQMVAGNRRREGGVAGNRRREDARPSLRAKTATAPLTAGKVSNFLLGTAAVRTPLPHCGKSQQRRPSLRAFLATRSLCARRPGKRRASREKSLHAASGHEPTPSVRQKMCATLTFS